MLGAALTPNRSIPYILAEIPSNLVLKRFGPHVMLPLYVTAWGIVTTLQGTSCPWNVHDPPG